MIRKLLIIGLALFVGLTAAVEALISAGIYFLLPFFGEISIWQVLAYVKVSPFLLPTEQRMYVWLCYAIGVVVMVFMTLEFVGLWKVFRRLYGIKGVLILVASLFIFLAEGAFFTFEYADSYFGLRYELRCLMRPSALYRQEFRTVTTAEVKFPTKRNLIVLVGESIEQAFLEESIFGTNMMPRLKRWLGRNASLGQMLPVHGSDHTVCSLFGMVYGSPRLQVNGPAAKVSFCDYPEVVLPNVWRIWVDNGFNCRFIQGGEINFARTDRVFRAIPEVVLHGMDFYVSDPDYIKEPKKHPFGVNDEVVIEKRLKGETLELAAAKQPFVLVAWTLNTHGSLGWRSKLRPARHPIVLADALMQADDMIVDYLEWVEQQPFAKDTALVFVGDHIFHGTLNGVENDSRYAVGAVAAKGVKNFGNRTFAAFDLAPTFLELSGAVLPERRFGIGTSLLSSIPTLIERIGRERYEDEIRSCGTDYRRMAIGW